MDIPEQRGLASRLTCVSRRYALVDPPQEVFLFIQGQCQLIQCLRILLALGLDEFLQLLDRVHPQSLGLFGTLRFGALCAFQLTLATQPHTVELVASLPQGVIPFGQGCSIDHDHGLARLGRGGSGSGTKGDGAAARCIGHEYLLGWAEYTPPELLISTHAEPQPRSGRLVFRVDKPGTRRYPALPFRDPGRRVKSWFSKDKDKSDKTGESEGPLSSAHPDDATLIEPPQVLRTNRELSAGERLAAQIQARAVEESAAIRVVPGARPDAPAREEAAALYAAGRAQEAAKVLTGSMQASRGQVERPVWYMLFDLYQATDQHVAFERLAMLFARAFNASPPAWETWTSAASSLQGRNVLVVDGFPSTMNQDKIVDFVAAARQARQARLDLSRTRFETDASAVDSIERLTNLMARLRRYRVRTLLMGETRLLEELRILIHQELAQSRPAWLLTFEILQWRGEEQQFETLALEYATRFEQSAPGFEPDGVIALNPDDDQDQAPERELTVDLLAPERLEASNIDPFIAAIDERLRRFGAARLDFSRQRLLTFDAATSLAAFLSALGVSPGRIVAVRPTELSLAILEMSGSMAYLGVESRKR